MKDKIIYRVSFGIHALTLSIDFFMLDDFAYLYCYVKDTAICCIDLSRYKLVYHGKTCLGEYISYSFKIEEI